MSVAKGIGVMSSYSDLCESVSVKVNFYTRQTCVRACVCVRQVSGEIVSGSQAIICRWRIKVSLPC